EVPNVPRVSARQDARRPARSLGHDVVPPREGDSGGVVSQPVSSDLTVVVPCRDAGRWIAELLDSLAAQTLLPREVILIDDGSIDGSAEQARAWQADQSDPLFPLRVLRQP